MQPYQEASQEIRRQGEIPHKLAKTGISIAGGLAGTGLALNRVLPFLSSYIPADLAIKGLSKLNPAFGKFAQKAIAAGKTLDEVKDFISQKVDASNEKKSLDEKNIIAQYSDELNEFLKNHIGQGRQPLEAGALAQLDPKFKKVIAQIEKDHKSPFSSILESTFGSAQQPQQMTQQPQGTPTRENTDQALMAALEKILQM